MLTEAGVRRLIPRHMIVAKRLRLGDLRICSHLRSFVGQGNRQIVCTTRADGEDGDPTGECHEAEKRFIVEWRTGSLREKFEQDGGETWSDQTLLADTATKVDQDLLKRQATGGFQECQYVRMNCESVYTRVWSAFSSGPVHDAAVALAGAQQALTQLVALGLPRALQDDELLHALLYGSQRLLDGSLVQEYYAYALNPSSESPWGWLDLKADLTAPGRNIRERLELIGKERRQLVRERLQAAFKRLEAGEPQVENVLDGALGRLAGTQLMLRAADAPPDQPPIIDEPPMIGGDVKIGGTLSADDGAWTSAAPVTLTRRWTRCNAEGNDCRPITDATGATYVLNVAGDSYRMRRHRDALQALRAGLNTPSQGGEFS